MKYILFTILLSLVSLTIHSQSAGFQQVSSVTFNQLIHKDNGVLLDVRTWSEFSNGHLQDAGYLNYYALDFKKKLLLLPKDQPIYLYCNTGYRSEKATEYLVKNGYKNVCNLEHGIMEWELKDLPEGKEPGARPDIVNKMDVDTYTELFSADELVFFDFYAPWCGPCRMMEPVLEELAEEYDNIKITKLNIDQNQETPLKYGVMNIPTLLFFKAGQEVDRIIGVYPKRQLKKKIEEHLA